MLLHCHASPFHTLFLPPHTTKPNQNTTHLTPNLTSQFGTNSIPHTPSPHYPPHLQTGQFGTRIMGGKDAASPRYVFTRLEEITRVLFHPEDDQVHI
jgi:hypothetical protein